MTLTKAEAAFEIIQLRFRDAFRVRVADSKLPAGDVLVGIRDDDSVYLEAGNPTIGGHWAADVFLDYAQARRFAFDANMAEGLWDALLVLAANAKMNDEGDILALAASKLKQTI